MRIALVAAIAGVTVGLSGLAHAAPAAVSVTIGPELQAKAAKVYGVRDVDSLAAELRTDVEHELARTSAYQDARIELVLIDAKPNRPTMKQLGDTPNLDSRSVSVGGARIGGRIVAPDGRVTPVGYQYYSANLREVIATGIWSDADATIQRFAHRLARGHPDGH